MDQPVRGRGPAVERRSSREVERVETMAKVALVIFLTLAALVADYVIGRWAGYLLIATVGFLLGCGYYQLKLRNISC
jgi:hypothetical protein